MNLTIEAIGNTTDIDPSKPPAAGTGFPAARLKNADPSKVDKYYRLRPDSEAEYFLWVTRYSATETQWTLIEVPRVGGQVNAAEPTMLRYCHKRPAGEKGESQADFAEFRDGGECTARYATTGSNVKTASAISLQSFVAGILSLLDIRWAAAEGGWIDCSNGCCT